ncbi:hypothetical protein ABG067_003745 [Albugo candida]
MAATRGAAFIGRYDLTIVSDRKSARSTLGYCQQFDALHDCLTVREKLQLYVRLKEYRSRYIPEFLEKKYRTSN